MQKIIRRTAEAERKAFRQRKRQVEKSITDAKWERIDAQSKALRSVNTALSRARAKRWEDWLQGPTAPNRSIVPGYGGSPSNLPVTFTLKNHELDARMAWAGGRHTLCIAVGDRVVVMQGHYQGKIAVISSINKNRGEVQLGDMTKINVKIPPAFLKLQPVAHATTPTAIGIPISWVRLLHPIPTPTGTIQDTIIHELVATGITRDRPTRTTSYNRLIPSLNLAIPWPSTRPLDPEAAKQAETAKQDAIPDHPADTIRLDLESPSYVPTLLRPPIPPGVINELRGYYSKFRTRHEVEWVSKKVKDEEDMVARLKFQKLSMRTPMQELGILTRLRRKARGAPVLSQEMLERLGEAMVKGDAGVGEIKQVLKVEGEKVKEKEGESKF